MLALCLPPRLTRGRAVRHTSPQQSTHRRKRELIQGSHPSRPRNCLSVAASNLPSHNGCPCNSPVSGGAPKPANTPPEQIDSNPPPLSKRWDKHPIISLGTGYKPRSRAASRGTSARRRQGSPFLEFGWRIERRVLAPSGREDRGRYRGFAF